MESLKRKITMLPVVIFASQIAVVLLQTTGCDQYDDNYELLHYDNVASELFKQKENMTWTARYDVTSKPDLDEFDADSWEYRNPNLDLNGQLLDYIKDHNTTNSEKSYLWNCAYKYGELRQLDYPAAYEQGFDARSKWRHCTHIASVYDQGSCNSGWAIAATSTISDRYCIRSQGKDRRKFSPVNLMNCCEKCGFCGGSYGIGTFLHWQYQGVVVEESTEGSYPFQARCGAPCSIKQFLETNKKTPNCPQIDPDRLFKGYVYVLGNTWESTERTFRQTKDSQKFDPNFATIGLAIPTLDDLFPGISERYPHLQSERIEMVKRELFHHGPVTSCFRIGQDMYHYRKGIYKRTAGKLLYQHCMKLVGWGSENDVDYWILVNSWGKLWGEDGTIRIQVNYQGLRKGNDGDVLDIIIAGQPMESIDEPKITLITEYREMVLDNDTEEVMFYNGKPVTLRCEATGYPVPRLYWMVQPNDQQPNITVPINAFTNNAREIVSVYGNKAVTDLIIDNAMPVHVKRYYCIAETSSFDQFRYDDRHHRSTRQVTASLNSLVVQLIIKAPLDVFYLTDRTVDLASSSEPIIRSTAGPIFYQRVIKAGPAGDMPVIYVKENDPINIECHGTYNGQKPDDVPYENYVHISLKQRPYSIGPLPSIRIDQNVDQNSISIWAEKSLNNRYVECTNVELLSSTEKHQSYPARHYSIKAKFHVLKYGQLFKIKKDVDICPINNRRTIELIFFNSYNETVPNDVIIQWAHNDPDSPKPEWEDSRSLTIVCAADTVGTYFVTYNDPTGGLVVQSTVLQLQEEPWSNQILA